MELNRNNNTTCQNISNTSRQFHTETLVLGKNKGLKLMS